MIEGMALYLNDRILEEGSSVYNKVMYHDNEEEEDADHSTLERLTALSWHGKKKANPETT